MKSRSNNRAKQTSGLSLPRAVLGVLRVDIEVGDLLLDYMQVLSSGEGSAGELLHFTYANNHIYSALDY